MLLPGILLAVFLAGCWIYCLTDAALTPTKDYAGWPKRNWVVFIAVTFIVGAAAWVIAGRRARARHRQSVAFDHLMLARLGDGNITWYPQQPPAGGTGAQPPGRHPAGRSRMTGQLPLGPDDDPEFLRQLARRIQGDPSE